MNRSALLIRASIAVVTWSAIAHGARPVAVEPPRWLRLQLEESYLQTEMEWESEERKSGGQTYERTSLFIAPVLGLRCRGSVYHPNLANFSVQVEEGLSWQQIEQSPNGGTRDDMKPLQRYHTSVTFLQEKPYATSFFADKDITYADFDFFNRAEVDSQRYGINTGWSAEPVPVNVSFNRLEETVTGIIRPTHLDEDTASVRVNPKRLGKSRTDFGYNYDAFRRQDGNSPLQKGVNHNVTFNDIDFFGQTDWIKLTSLLLYHRLDEAPNESQSLFVNENLVLEHERNLSSFYIYSFDTRSFRNSDTYNHQATAGLSHKLYESLSSTFNVHGNRTTISSANASQDTTRYGVGLNETYTKRLTAQTRLTVSFGTTVDEQMSSSGGSAITIVDESHTLTDGITTFLNQPNVNDSTIIVTDPSHTITYTNGFDYVIPPHGVLTEIKRVPGGLIPNGGTVLVTYSAAPQGTGDYMTILNQFNIRLDFFRNLLGLYARYNQLDYEGGEGVVLQKYRDAVAGADVNWRWLRAGAEYEQYRSTFSSHNAVRLFQSASYQPADGITLGLDLSESRIENIEARREQNSFSAIGHAHARLTSRLTWSGQSGVRFEHANDYKQDFFTARSEFNAQYGKTTIHLGYEYQNETLNSEIRVRHYLYLRARRTF
jgi:hypothetical protein